MDDLLSNVAIIGAGLGGCALALALSSEGIPVTIYESRAEISSVIPSGVVLTPNGLQVLDNLGVFARIRDNCYVPQYRVFKNSRDETTKKVSTGGLERYGYQNHRIWRKTLLDEMRQMLQERNVQIQFNSKFSGLVHNVESNDTDSVSFLINSTPQTASLLIGADGIHSKVRNSYLAPEISPEYTGLVAMLCHIPRSSISWPYPDYESNATIQDAAGAIFWIAEDPQGEELMIGLQVSHPQQSKEALDALQKDADELAKFYTRDYDKWESATARKIIDSVVVHKDKLYIWPFMRMPQLPRWFDRRGRVVLLGDAAHALPPSSGQGVNQALEDVLSLNFLLSELRKLKNLDMHKDVVVEGLMLWQNLRQERLDAVLDWTNNGSNVSRLPEAERKKLLDEGKVKDDQFDDMTWLYKPGTCDEIRSWVQSKA